MDPEEMMKMDILVKDQRRESANILRRILSKKLTLKQ